jgi:hypothetical protein
LLCRTIDLGSAFPIFSPKVQNRFPRRSYIHYTRQEKEPMVGLWIFCACALAVLLRLLYDKIC